MEVLIYFWKFIHNALVHPLMAWPWEPEWVRRLHDRTAPGLSPRTLIVRLRVNDYFVEADNHTWAAGKSIDDALGNWLRTHQKNEGFTVLLQTEDALDITAPSPPQS